MPRFEEHTERQWFVKGAARGDIRQADDEQDAREMAAWNPGAESTVLYRDVTYGPLVEASA